MPNFTNFIKAFDLEGISCHQIKLFYVELENIYICRCNSIAFDYYQLSYNFIKSILNIIKKRYTDLSIIDIIYKKYIVLVLPHLSDKEDNNRFFAIYDIVITEEQSTRLEQMYALMHMILRQNMIASKLKTSMDILNNYLNYYKINSALRMHFINAGLQIISSCLKKTMVLTGTISWVTDTNEVSALDLESTLEQLNYSIAVYNYYKDRLYMRTRLIFNQYEIMDISIEDINQLYNNLNYSSIYISQYYICANNELKCGNLTFKDEIAKKLNSDTYQLCSKYIDTLICPSPQQMLQQVRQPVRQLPIQPAPQLVQPPVQPPVRQQPAQHQPAQQPPVEQPVEQQPAQQQPAQQQPPVQPPVRQQPAQQQPLAQLPVQPPVRQQPAQQQPEQQPAQHQPAQQPVEQPAPQPLDILIQAIQRHSPEIRIIDLCSDGDGDDNGNGDDNGDLSNKRRRLS